MDALDDDTHQEIMAQFMRASRRKPRDKVSYLKSNAKEDDDSCVISFQFNE